MDDLTEMLHTCSKALDDDGMLRSALDDILAAFDRAKGDREAFVRELHGAAYYLSWHPKGPTP